MNKVTVLKYNENWQCHKCRRENGDEAWVDLLVDGGLGDMPPESLIGKTVEFHYEHSFMTIAHGVRVAEES